MNDEEILLEVEARNGWRYNHMKALEEFAELSEVLLKKLNKDGSPKEPTDRSIIDEIGDCKLRIRILEYIYGIEEVKQREKEKLAKWEDYIVNNKYQHI